MARLVFLQSAKKHKAAVMRQKRRSPGGKHAATLVYNVFGERLFFAGRQGGDDAYEQPFNSLDLVYTWYPSDQVSVKAKLKNILDEKLEIDQSNVTVIEQEIGTSGALELKWTL